MSATTVGEPEDTFGANRSVDSSPNRRWLLAVQTPSGPAHLAIEVPDGHGAVFVAVGGRRVRLTPPEVSRLRKVLLDAQALALQDSGQW